MASPQIEKGYLRIANELFDEILKRDFTKRQLSIVFFIIRFSYGCQRKQTLKLRNIDFDVIGLYPQNAKTELDYLKQAKVINYDEETKIFSVNKDYSQWRISYYRKCTDEKFDTLIHQQLEGIQAKEKNDPEDQEPKNKNKQQPESEAEKEFNEGLKYAGRWE